MANKIRFKTQKKISNMEWMDRGEKKWKTYNGNVEKF